MRICHVIDYFHTDVGYQEYYLARDQAVSGHAVTVITTNLRQHTVATAGPDEQEGHDRLVEAGVTLRRLPAHQLGHDRCWVRSLHRAITTERPDAVHVHGPFAPTTVRAVSAASSARASILVDNHIQEAIAPASTTGLNRRIYDIYRRVFGAYLRSRVDTWVANGPNEGAFLSDRLGLGASAVNLVPLGFDPGVFAWTPDRRQRGRAKLGASPTDAVIAITGKIHAGKRPEVVARAAQTLARSRPTLLVLAGSITPDSRLAIESAAPDLLNEGRIIHLGMLGRSDLSDLFHASDAVVFPQLPSISIYEASGTGTRVLVGRDRFSQWLNGLCGSIEPIDADHLDLTDVGPLDDDVRRSRAIAALSVFAWHQISDAFIDMYRAPRKSTSRHRT